MSLGNGVHFRGPLLGSENSRGGLLEDCPIDIVNLVGSRYKSWFEDFTLTTLVDGEVAGAGAIYGDPGTATAPEETVTADNGYLFINPGTKADSGTQLQFTGVVTGGATTPIFRTPGIITSSATLMDNRELIWAARIGIMADDTLWSGKMLVGLFLEDTTLLSETTGLPTVGAGGGAGFHLAETGEMTLLSTNAAITAAGTAMSPAVSFATAGDLTTSTFTWMELGFRCRWGDASAGTGVTTFYKDGRVVGRIEDTMPMDSTEVYATAFCIANGPAGNGNIVDMAVDWVYTAMTRPGHTNTSSL